MTITTRLGHATLTVAAAALALVLAGSASAGSTTYRMSGKWLQQRGVVNIPAWVVALGSLNKTLFGIADPSIPGSGFVTVSPASTGPPRVTLQPGLFQLDTERAIPLQAALSAAFGASNAGDVIQLTTTFSFVGPGAVGVLQQTGTTVRMMNDFMFCPGAVSNPECPNNIQGGDDGVRPGRVQYTAGPFRYGGVMGMLITGGGEVANSLGGTPLEIRHDVIAGAGSQEVGLAYGNTSSVVLVGGQITTGATFTANGLIGAPGMVIGTGAADTNINTGFPWTTGQVQVSEPGMVTTMDQVETYTMTGSNNLTHDGRGTVSLVAGGLSHRLVSGQTFVSVDKVTLDISSGQLTPALSPAGMVAIASLLLIGGGYALRRRF